MVPRASRVSPRGLVPQRLSGDLGQRQRRWGQQRGSSAAAGSAPGNNGTKCWMDHPKLLNPSLEVQRTHAKIFSPGTPSCELQDVCLLRATGGAFAALRGDGRDCVAVWSFALVAAGLEASPETSSQP